MKSSITNQPSLPVWKRRTAWLALVPALAVLLLGMMATAGGKGAASSAKIRPIEDFLEAQGTAPIPPPANYACWMDPKTGLLLLPDYAGLDNKWLEQESNGLISLGTETAGTVIERPLPDGRAEVTVLLHTKNALTMVAWWNPDFVPPEPPWGQVLFGHLASDVLDGADPALGECFLKWVFINDAPGAPLPDLFFDILLQPDYGHEWIMLSLEAHADGTLREEFGVPDGTPGRAQATQIGVFQTGGKGATADGYPAEHIKLEVVGR